MPTFPWRGSHSIPREMSLVQDEEGAVLLKQMPVKEIASLREKTWSYSQVTIGQASHPEFLIRFRTTSH